MALDSFNVYHSYLKALEPLNDAECGRLLKACLQYSMTGVVPELRGNERFLFPLIKADIDRQKAKDHSGKNHWNWKGGITPANQVQRNSKAAKAWRKSVFMRDNYTCALCGKVGGRLNAHHIKPWASYPELRFDINNGTTLCQDCHRAIHRRA